MIVKGKAIDVTSTSMEEIVKLERIYTRLSSNLSHVQEILNAYTKSGFLTHSLQSDQYLGRFPTNTFSASLVFHKCA
jgi:hypothetical protein